MNITTGQMVQQRFRAAPRYRGLASLHKVNSLAVQVTRPVRVNLNTQHVTELNINKDPDLELTSNVLRDYQFLWQV